jgi:hypothetical protein
VADGGVDVLIKDVYCDACPIGVTVHNHPGKPMPTSVVVRNVAVVNVSRNAFQVSYDDAGDASAVITFEDCTAQSSGNHGFSLANINAGRLGGIVTLRRCMASNAAKGYYHLAAALGCVRLEDCTF